MLKFLKPLSFIPALLMMYMIFSFSSQDGIASSQLSYKVSYKIVETGGQILGEDLEPWEIDSIATRFHGVIRKIAHMGEYFLLAIAVSFPLYVYGLRGILLMLVAGFICVAFACGDEYHQSFVEGRGPSKRDVMIDSFGVFWGIVLVRIIGWTGRKTIFRPFGKKKKQKQAACQQAYSGPQYSAGGGQFYGGAPGAQPYSGGNQAPYVNPSQPYGNVPPAGAGYGSGAAQVPPYGNSAPSGMPSYGNVPNGAQPYGNAFAGTPPYGNPSGPGYSGPGYGNAQPHPSCGGPQYVTPPVYQGQGAEDDTSDRLSEDMSLKKLVRDLKDQKKEHRRESKSSRAVHDSSYGADGFRVNEVDLDDDDDKGDAMHL